MSFVPSLKRATTRFWNNCQIVFGKIPEKRHPFNPHICYISGRKLTYITNILRFQNGFSYAAFGGDALFTFCREKWIEKQKNWNNFVPVDVHFCNGNTRFTIYRLGIPSKPKFITQNFRQLFFNSLFQ